MSYHGLPTRSQAVLLRHLMDSAGPVTRSELAGALWGHREDGGGLDRTIPAFLHQIRSKLRPGVRIENESGRGWRLAVDEDALERAVISRVADMLTDSRGDRVA